MKKGILSILLVSFIIIIGAGCSNNEPQSVKLTNNDTELFIELSTDSDYSIKKKNNTEYEVYKDDEKYAVSYFISEEEYDRYAEETHGTEGCTIKGVGEVNGIAYMFFKYEANNEVQYNRIIYVDDGIYMFLSCYTDDEEIAKEIFYDLSFSIK